MAGGTLGVIGRVGRQVEDNVEGFKMSSIDHIVGPVSLANSLVVQKAMLATRKHSEYDNTHLWHV